jgi:phosphatidate phosphatase APP1
MGRQDQREVVAMLNNIIVVSDIDDTIKWSHILDPEVLVDGLNYHLAFKGMPELYTSLASAGARIEYVTGAPDLLVGKLQINSIPQKVISTNRFPQIELLTRC